MSKTLKLRHRLLLMGLMISLLSLWNITANISKSLAQSTQPTSTSQRQQVQTEVVNLKLQLERSPNDEKLLIQLGQLLIKLGELPEALTYLREASRINPNSYKTQYLIAYNLRSLKRYRESVVAYEKFLEIAPPTQKNSGLFGLAKTLELLGNTDRAVEVYQKYISVETRPQQRRWITQAQNAIRQLQASQVTLIDSKQKSEEAEELSDETDTSAQPSKQQLVVKPQPKNLTANSIPLEKNREQSQTAQESTQTPSQTPSQKSREPVKKETNNLEPLNIVLERGDRLFADKKYEEATKVYQSLAQRSLPPKLEVQLRYFASVSAYLSAQFETAQHEAEIGLLIEPNSARLRGLAVLSFVQHREQKTHSPENYQRSFAQIRIALREGRFQNCLMLIDQLVNSAQTTGPTTEQTTEQTRTNKRTTKTQKDKNKHLKDRTHHSILGDPLLLHAKGRALLGMKRYQEAYEVLSRAARGLNHPHLTLDLALTARRLGDLKQARTHFEQLRNQTAPSQGSSSSLLHLLAGEGIEQ